MDFRTARFVAGFTQTQVAEVLEVSQVQVSRLERGKATLDDESRRKLEKLFALPISCAEASD
jgi:transcriptional regulator with XRE-family HTH domain